MIEIIQKHEILKHKSYCCDADIVQLYNEIVGVWSQSHPFCTKCGKFPKADPDAIKKAIKWLDDKKNKTMN